MAWFTGGQRGFNTIEFVLMMGILVLAGTLVLPNLFGRHARVELQSTRERMVAVLADAQSRSVAGIDGKSWGVHFDNASGAAFYALYATAYATATTELHLPLPRSVRYVTSSIPINSFVNVLFLMGTGAPSVSSSIAIISTTVGGNATITVNTNGVIDY